MTEDENNELYVSDKVFKWPQKQEYGILMFPTKWKEVEVEGGKCPNCNIMMIYIPFHSHNVFEHFNPLMFCPKCCKYYEGELDDND